MNVYRMRPEEVAELVARLLEDDANEYAWQGDTLVLREGDRVFIFELVGEVPAGKEAR